MEKARVLVVDDEPRYRELLTLNLEREGYAVLAAKDGLGALNALERQEPDLVVLDLRLPDIDGYDVCGRIRQRSGVPILILTARAEEADKVRGLRLGADDYVTKPFGADELLARVEALLRRAGGSAAASAPPFRRGDLTIDFSQRRSWVGDREVELTPVEYRLLQYLALNAGRVVVYEELLRRVWGHGYETDVELLYTTIRRIRRKLGDDARVPRLIHTRRDIGYLLGGPRNGKGNGSGSGAT